MSDIKLELDAQETLNTQMELSIRAVAVRMATTVIMIEMSFEDLELVNKFKNRFAFLVKDYEIDITEGIYGRRGNIDLTIPGIKFKQ